MNYRHIYHAGNFADVVKHAVLALVIERLKHKDAPFRVIDTHAGLGAYDLGSDAAARTGEWHDGIGRLIGAQAEPLPAEPAALLKPYLDVVRGFNGAGQLARYPGSPRIARALLRPQDRLVVNELHPDDAAVLRAALGRDPQVKVMEIDGWTALKALLPPPERRGVVLVDPPFEVPGEMARLAQGLGEAVKRFATGTYLLWYPIKDRRQVRRLESDLKALPVRKLLRLELTIRPDTDPMRLSGCGLAVLNPPFGLDEQMDRLLPVLARRLALEPVSGWAADWLIGEA